MQKKQIKKKDILPELSRKLAILDKIFDIRRSRLAASLGIELDTYTRYTITARTPSLEILATLAVQYNLSLDWLILDRGPTYFKDTADPPDGSIPGNPQP